ncbi:hypothetical protein HMPREF9701_03167 [Delftia acidovorans CCUG 274B]|uniref:hypothetical protein n=1 Tax=Delftia acidovorans TaxID=80866 RepID=UPI00035427F3|nr:hypothetical protein [Delftia acidovorans]EPD39202.1 hypothetical protein HMPREF9701_03167 [Delftia acidovorans CCUG 274B]
MNAVAEKPKARRKAGAVASSPTATPAVHAPAPTFEESRALFRMASQALHEASRTDEPHGFSVESDRLLRIGSGIALQASTANKEEHESAAYDVAACINAARLVPGDTESTARTAFIATAAAALGQVTGDTPEQIVFTDVKRPKKRGRCSVTPTEKEIEDTHFDAMCWMGCAKAVLEFYAEHSDSDLLFGISDLVAMYYQKSEAEGDAMGPGTRGDLIAGPPPNLSAKIAAALEVVHKANDDDIMLHSAAYLLERAMHIAGGELLDASGDA